MLESAEVRVVYTTTPLQCFTAGPTSFSFAGPDTGDAGAGRPC